MLVWRCLAAVGVVVSCRERRLEVLGRRGEELGSGGAGNGGAGQPAMDPRPALLGPGTENRACAPVPLRLPLMKLRSSEQ